VPALYEKFMSNNENVTVVDEWTLSLAMGDKLPEEMENHYKTFIVSSLLCWVSHPPDMTLARPRKTLPTLLVRISMAL
jgi:hypothetical protein